MTPEERQKRRDRARELRLSGYSNSQIARELALKSGGKALNRWLKGMPPPEWTRRPRAKDDLRAKAVEMRLAGHSYNEIRKHVPVSTATLSLWLRDVPLTDLQKASLRRRKQDAIERTAQKLHERRLEREAAIRREAIAQIGMLTDRDLFVAGVVAYWAEGAKNKPWRRGERVIFLNSDPGLVVLFLRWLDCLGVERDRLIFRVHIHESADVVAAVRFWSDVVGVAPEILRKPTLKRHNPRTVRKNNGNDYHGCLRIDVRRSVDLNRRIEGWFRAIVANLPPEAPCRRASSLDEAHSLGGHRASRILD